MHIRKSEERDLPRIFTVINEAARVYRGVIPSDQWHDPYMSHAELVRAIAEGVVFWVAEEQGRLAGVMGIQEKGSVVLIRHAYIAPDAQRRGTGTALLRHLESLTDRPVLIGTWAAASWAIDFYRRNGFALLQESEKDHLLRTFWSIPERQRESSVVLADSRWLQLPADVRMRT